MVANTNIQSIGIKVEKTYQKVINTVIAVFAVTLVMLGLPGLTSSALAGPGGTTVEGVVIRFDVFDVEESVGWYTELLDMDFNKESSALPYYGQVFYPEYPDTQIGLSAGHPNSGTATATIVVDDIFAAQQGLMSQGVDVDDICSAGEGVVLAFFCDPFGNNLALRQDNFLLEIKLPYCGAPICNNSRY